MVLAHAALGAILIGLGICIIWFLGSKMLAPKIIHPNVAMALDLVIGLVFIVTGGWLMLKDIAVEVLKMKAVGFILFAFGFFLVFYFPATAGEVPRYQPLGMTRAGFLLGLVLFFIGLYLLLFY